MSEVNTLMLIGSTSLKPFNVIPSANGEYRHIKNVLPCIGKIKIDSFTLQAQMLPIRNIDSTRCDVTEALASIVEFYQVQKLIPPKKQTPVHEVLVVDNKDGLQADIDSSFMLDPLEAEPSTPNYLNHRSILSQKISKGDPDRHQNTSFHDEDIEPIDAFNLLLEFGIEEEKAEDRKRANITGFAKISTKDELKQYLMEYGPAFITLPVTSHHAQFWKSDKIIVGYHACVVVGWTDKSFIIRNNWGTDWNGDGHCLYSFKDFEKGIHDELWGIIDIHNLFLNKRKFN